MTKRYDTARQAVCDLVEVRDLAVYNQRSVRRNKLCKAPERSADIRKILEEVQVVRFNI